MSAHWQTLMDFGERGAVLWEADAPVVGVLLFNLRRNQRLVWVPKKEQVRAAEVVDIYLGALHSCFLSGDFERYYKGVGPDPFIT